MMKGWNWMTLLLLLALADVPTGCKRQTSTAVKGQSNAALTFYGLAIDQDGKPLANIRVTYESSAFPNDWTFEKRGEPLVRTIAGGTTDSSGRFEFSVVTHTLRRRSVEAPPGYRHFFEEHVGTRPGVTVPSTFGYLVSSWSDLCYKSDPAHPAVFVFVKDGIHEVSALPCRGGYDSGNGTNWTLNTPAWPLKPSLTDVVYKPSSTQPTTQP
jgi:hypothetical protein